MPAVFTLLTSDGQPCVGQPLTVKPPRLDLQLQTAQGQVLDASTMLVFTPVADNQKNVELEALTTIISTDQGTFTKDKSVTWLLADWGVERPLSKCEIKLKAVEPNCKARIKIYTNGHWLPLTPLDILAVGSAQVFTPVMASKVMIELVTAGTYAGLWNPLAVTVTELNLAASTAPVDLELSLAGQSLFKQPGLLPTQGMSTEDFADAINAYVQQNPNIAVVPLQLSTKTAGKLNIEFTPVTLKLIEQLTDPADGKLNLTWQEGSDPAQASAQTSLTLGKKAKLQELSFMPVYEPIAESLCFNTGTTANSRAQFADGRAELAQGFQTDAEGINLTGFDIKLDNRNGALAATLSLHPDKHGYPSEQPYTGATLTIDSQPQDKGDWLSLSFPKPIHLPDAQWWLVLTVQQGDAIWWLGNTPPAQAGACLYRMDQGAWLAGTQGTWLQTRVRLQSPRPEGLSNITVQRGKANAALILNPDRSYRTDADALGKLNKDASTQLSITMTAPAPGLVTLSKLRLTTTS